MADLRGWQRGQTCARLRLGFCGMRVEQEYLPRNSVQLPSCFRTSDIPWFAGKLASIHEAFLHSFQVLGFSGSQVTNLETGKSCSNWSFIGF